MFRILDFLKESILDLSEHTTRRTTVYVFYSSSIASQIIIISGNNFKFAVVVKVLLYVESDAVSFHYP